MTSEADFKHLVDTYSRDRAFDDNRSAAEERKALKTIDTTLSKAAALIGESMQSFGATNRTPTHDAWLKIHADAGAHSDPSPLNNAEHVYSLLLTWSTCAVRAQRKSVPRKHSESARAMLASRIQSLHGEQFSTHREGISIALMLEVARAAGDSHLTPAAAYKVFQDTK